MAPLGKTEVDKPSNLKLQTEPLPHYVIDMNDFCRTAGKVRGDKSEIGKI